ncbi:F-box domain containing protein [Trema orientale]|uniref:F-box domain containing protein n=1 Tax=Trema orientale TaxID=63057 RepID=A0A2P5B5P7_TREOI|nr:F-box domain containing protein [Trema orientale]
METALSPLLAGPQNEEMRRLCELPAEIMMEILLRLPPESLLRFKCVCKSWYALLTDPSFANKHLHFSKSRVSASTSLFLTWCRQRLGDPDRVHFRSLVTISDSDDPEGIRDHITTVIEDLDLSTIPHQGNLQFSSASQCNGIICLAPDSLLHGETVLYNPATREFKFLPKTCLGPRASQVGGFIAVEREGFGYDLKANDYKLVRIVGSLYSNKCIAEVYSMASHSWREIQIDMAAAIGLSDYNRIGLCCKGIFYWYVSMPNRILCFDMSSDEFHSIPLPAPHNVKPENVCSRTYKTLALWNESIALLISGGVMSIEIWVMDDYHGAVEASWTKHLTISTISCCLYHPIMFLKKDELLMASLADVDTTMVSFNVVTHKLKNLCIHGVSPFSCVGSFYTKSLVSVNGGN